MSSDFGGRETFYLSVRESEQIHLVGLRSDSSTSMWLRAVCTFASLCSLMLAVCGHLTREQFTLVSRPVPGEVNTHRHTHTHTHTQTKRDPKQGNCYTHTLTGISFDGVLTACRINTHTLSSGLIWAAAPSAPHMQPGSTMAQCAPTQTSS